MRPDSFFKWAMLAVLFALIVTPSWLAVADVFDVSLETFLRENYGVLTSLGTLALVSGLALLTTHLSNRSAERREVHNRRIQAALQIAQFRQSWIEQLRRELASLRAQLTAAKKENFSTKEAQEKLSHAFLMLNANEDKTKELWACVTDFAKAYVDVNAEGKSSALSKFDDVARALLKEEWDRLKRELEAAQRVEL
jgi:hypothetical protein